MVLRMAILTDDAGETFWNVPRPRFRLAIYPDPSLSMGLSDSGLQSAFFLCLVDPFLIILVDRFPLGPLPVCISLHALFLKALEGYTLPLQLAERLSSDSHASRYQAFLTLVVSLIKHMLFEQNVDA
ncbi:unnamed protein product [Protopolystoma xenopodis]|uniref:Uncharacterized protein n=1 Tax=Protopolystoma xenopodis TaxID=117903 RepID=A0A448XRF9_9PLAT|nr:unnamed protein product [Protopolystoma xenopodis]